MSEKIKIFPYLATYNANAVSHCMTGQIPVEASTHRSSVAVDASNFAPNSTDTGLAFRMLWHTLLGLRFVDIHAALSNVELAVLLATCALNLKQPPNLFNYVTSL